MKIITKYAFLLSVVMLSACSADDETTKNENTIITNPVETEMSFSASIEDGNITRTAFSEYNSGTKNYLKTVWTVADAIRIYNIAATNNNNGSFAIKEGGIDENDGKQAVFTGEKITSNGSDDKFYAVYPDKSTNTSFSQEGDVVKLNATLPAVQTAITDNINPDLQFMTGYTTKRNFDFKNVVSFIKVTIANSTTAGKFKIHAIRFTSNNSENKIAGSFTATVTEGANPVISSVSTGAASSVVVENADQSPLNDGTYYIAVLPTTLNNGFTLQLEDLTSGKEQIYKRKSTASYTIARSKVIDLGSYNAESSLENGTIYDGGIIDLGLPSGTLWATRNLNDTHGDNVFAAVGEYGGYYSWGEVFAKGEIPTYEGNYSVVPTVNYTLGDYNGKNNATVAKEDYSWKTYKYGYIYEQNSNFVIFTSYDLIYEMGNDNQSWLGWLWKNNYRAYLDKYNTVNDLQSLKYSTNVFYLNRPVFGDIKSPVDNLKELDIVDDAAYLKTNGKFIMPTKNDAVELSENVSHINSKLTSKVPGYTTRSITMPLAGSYYWSDNKTQLKEDGSRARYWTKSLAVEEDQIVSIAAASIDFKQSATSISINDDDRYAGKTIRPILNAK